MMCNHWRLLLRQVFLKFQFTIASSQNESTVIEFNYFHGNGLKQGVCSYGETNHLRSDGNRKAP